MKDIIISRYIYKYISWIYSFNQNDVPVVLTAFADYVGNALKELRSIVISGFVEELRDSLERSRLKVVEETDMNESVVTREEMMWYIEGLREKLNEKLCDVYNVVIQEAVVDFDKLLLTLWTCDAIACDTVRSHPPRSPAKLAQ